MITCLSVGRGLGHPEVGIWSSASAGHIDTVGRPAGSDVLATRSIPSATAAAAAAQPRLLLEPAGRPAVATEHPSDGLRRSPSITTSPTRPLPPTRLLLCHADLESVAMHENLWIALGPTRAACLQVPKDLECCLAVGWLETTWNLCFRRYVFGDEQCSFRAGCFRRQIIDLGLDTHIERQVGQLVGLPGSGQLSSSCLWLSGSGGQTSQPCPAGDHFGGRGLFTIADGVEPDCSE
jgi:hypothetical protein